MDFALGVGAVDRRDRATCEDHGVKDDRVFRNVRGHERHHVAWAKSVLHQASSEATNLIVKLGVGKDSPRGAIDQRGLVAKFRSIR